MYIKYLGTSVFQCAVDHVSRDCDTEDEKQYLKNGRFRVFECVGRVSRNSRAFMWENPQFGFPTRSDTNRTVQSQKQARSLKF